MDWILTNIEVILALSFLPAVLIMELGIVFSGAFVLSALGSAVEAKRFPGVNPKGKRTEDFRAYVRESIIGLGVPAGLLVLACLASNTGLAAAGAGILLGYFAAKAAVKKVV